MKCLILECPNEGKHKFPTDLVRRQMWIKATRIETQKKIMRYLRNLCSDHFKPSDFIICSNREIKLKKNSVPSIFPWTSPVPTTVNRQKRPKTYSRPIHPTAYVETFPLYSNISTEDENDPLQSDQEIIHLSPEETIPDYESCIDIMTENYSRYTNNDHLVSCATQSTMNVHCKLTQTENIPFSYPKDAPFGINKFMNNDEAIHFYTGLETSKKFAFVFSTLGDCSNLNYFYQKPPSKISTLEQYFITLLILRRHREFKDIAMTYTISLKEVSNIFITWIRFIALQWRNVDLWLDRDLIQAHMPWDFYEKYPLTRIIIDATEFPIKKPGLPLAQQATFSTYKNRNTLKSLIGIAPSGMITYVSPCYAGSTTDRQIIERSDILNKFISKDEVMVDKGINVQDIFLQYGVKINMPAFFKKGNQINPVTLSNDRKVASKRVHVERVIGMLKTYKILVQPMNQTETVLSSDIVFIISMLVNFRSKIINKEA